MHQITNQMRVGPNCMPETVICKSI